MLLCPAPTGDPGYYDTPSEFFETQLVIYRPEEKCNTMKHKIRRTQTRADARAEVSETVTQSRPRQLIRGAGRLKSRSVSALNPSPSSDILSENYTVSVRSTLACDPDDFL